MTLNINNLGKVWEALFDARPKAYNIGLKLEVPVGTLDSIKKQYSDPSDQLRETLKAWLKMAAQQKWQTIVDALRSRIIGEPKLASDIEAEYCQGTPGQASGQATPMNTQMEALQQQVMALQLQLESKSQPQQTVERLEQRLREQQRAIEAGERKQRELTEQLQSVKQTVTQPRDTDQLRQKLREEQRAIEAGQRQQRELKEQLQSMKQPAAQPQPELKQLPSMKRPAARPHPNPSQQKTTLRKLIWRDGPKAPERMSCGSTATDGTTVYCNSGGGYDTSVHQYHSDTQQWKTLPDLPHHGSTLVMADSKLTSVGGYRERFVLFGSKATDSLLSLTGEGRDRKWLKLFPPMPTKRYRTAAICHGNSLIVVGGDDGRNILTTVEVLNMDTLLWSIASSLPHPFTEATTSICGERLYLLGGFDQTYSPTRSVLTATIPELLNSCQTLSQSTIWQHVADAPYKASSCATLCGQLVAVGGKDEGKKATTAVSAYNDSIKSWLPMEAMKTPRWRALVASLHDNTMLVIGGYNGRYLDTVEIAKLS